MYGDAISDCVQQSCETRILFESNLSPFSTRTQTLSEHSNPLPPPPHTHTGILGHSLFLSLIQTHTQINIYLFFLLPTSFHNLSIFFCLSHSLVYFLFFPSFFFPLSYFHLYSYLPKQSTNLLNDSFVSLSNFPQNIFHL